MQHARVPATMAPWGSTAGGRRRHRGQHPCPSSFLLLERDDPVTRAAPSPPPPGSPGRRSAATICDGRLLPSEQINLAGVLFTSTMLPLTVHDLPSQADFILLLPHCSDGGGIPDCLLLRWPGWAEALLPERTTKQWAEIGIIGRMHPRRGASLQSFQFPLFPAALGRLSIRSATLAAGYETTFWENR